MLWSHTLFNGSTITTSSVFCELSFIKSINGANQILLKHCKLNVHLDKSPGFTDEFQLAPVTVLTFTNVHFNDISQSSNSPEFQMLYGWGSGMNLDLVVTIPFTVVVTVSLKAINILYPSLDTTTIIEPDTLNGMLTMAYEPIYEKL